MECVSVASRHSAGLLRRLRVNLVTRAHGQRGLWDRRLPVGTKMISPQIYHACVSLRTVVLIDVVRQWRKNRDQLEERTISHLSFFLRHTTCIRLVKSLFKPGNDREGY